MPLQSHYKIVIIGSGPAGRRPAIYTARANLSPLVLEGSQPGGQHLDHGSRKLPGFADGILGPDMMEIFCQQARRFGAELYMDDVTRVDFSQRPFLLEVGSATLRTDAVIIATGAAARMLGLPAEKRCWATVSLPAPLVMVSSSVAKKWWSLVAVMLPWKRPCFSPNLPPRSRSFTGATGCGRENHARTGIQTRDIAFLWDTVVEDIVGEPGAGGGVQAVTIRHVNTNETRDENRWRVSRHWPYPQFDALSWAARSRRPGLHCAEPGTTVTSVDGVFAAGDIVDKVYRQAITAAGSGCMAAIDAERWLEAQGL